MTGRIAGRLAEMGIDLPEPKAPLAQYVPFVQTGNLLFVSGQLPMGPDGMVTGKLTGSDHAIDGVPVPDSKLAKAAQAAGFAAVNLLVQAKAATGDLDRITRVVKLTGFVNCDGSFSQQHLVINGASTLLGEVFGDAGKHARSAVGCSSLPLEVIVEIEGIFEIA
jgi:enamine deaminase RidA (YjgF/YER057c/UK114 family)